MAGEAADVWLRAVHEEQGCEATTHFLLDPGIGELLLSIVGPWPQCEGGTRVVRLDHSQHLLPWDHLSQVPMLLASPSTAGEGNPF